MSIKTQEIYILANATTEEIMNACALIDLTPNHHQEMFDTEKSKPSPEHKHIIKAMEQIEQTSEFKKMRKELILNIAQTAVYYANEDLCK